MKPIFYKQRQPLWRRVLTAFATSTAMLLLGGAFAVLVMEWMAGCGESYIDADGVRHQYECLFLTLHK